MLKSNGMVFFDIFELKDCIFGAPNIVNNSFKKIYDYSQLLSESNPSDLSYRYFSIANEQTSGIRLRFKTESKKIALSFEVVRKAAYERVMISASSGFDVYYVKKNRYYHLTVIAPDEQILCYDEVFELPDNDYVEIYFPLYNIVKRMSVGVIDGCLIQPMPYKNDKKIVFYGNSCTQGAGASRSGNAYPNIVSRLLSIDVVNYAFNSACHGETWIADELSTKGANAFVIDYQFNSSIEEFKKRFESFYLCIRDKNKRTPIILVDTLSQNQYNQHISTVYRKNKSKDPYLFYVELSKLLDNIDRGILSIDGIHISDIGGPLLAESIARIIKRYL